MKTKFIILSISMAFVLFSCKNKNVEEAEVETNLIEISKEQFLSEKMTVGTPTKIAIEEGISFTGKVVSKLNGGSVIISAPVEGIVTDIYVQAGQELKSNETLLKIGGSAIIELQQQFAISSAKIKQLKANFDRAKELFKENISTENDFMLVESNYLSELANYSALKLKLKNIGLNISSIEKGEYAASYSIRTPISGQLSQIASLKGQFVSAAFEIAEIVNKDKIELKLAFFEKDFSKIFIGQKVLFSTMNDKEQSTTAVINRIGNKINANSNTFDCYATIAKENSVSYAINQLVRGEVITATDSVFAVPQTAVLSSGNQQFVLVVVSEDADGYSLEKVNVKIGKSGNNFVELIDFPNENRIILSGTYNIIAE